MPPRSKYTLEFCRELARQRGGRCTSETYVSHGQKMGWACAAGHEWSALFPNVKKGAWCPRCCSRPRATIEDARALARKRGGRCLSLHICNAPAVARRGTPRLRWRCGAGHEWAAPVRAVRNGVWCRACDPRASR